MSDQRRDDRHPKHIGGSHCDDGPFDDLIRLADQRLGQQARPDALRAYPQATFREAHMFASKFELPDHFGARVTAIHQHLTEAQSTENNRNRREALRKGLLESCWLLQDVDMGAVSYELEQLLHEQSLVNEIPPPPGELERFLKVERKLLTEVGISGTAIDDIDRLIPQVTSRSQKIITPDDMVVRFRRLQEMICARSDESAAEARAIGARTVWFGVAGATLVVLDAGAVAVAAPVATLSLTVGGGLIGRAIG